MPQTLNRLAISLKQFTLRQRMLLLFAGLAGATLLSWAVALSYGYVRHRHPWALDAVIIGGVLGGCATLVFIVGMWRLFDEHVAKPLERLAGELRARAHANVTTPLEDMEARHLGDLAPAATALIRHLSEARNELAEAIARETTRQVMEKQRLIALLSDFPVGVLICTADHRLVLYNGRAVDILGYSATRSSAADSAFCLDRPVFEYIEEAEILSAYHELQTHADSGATMTLRCVCHDHGACLDASMRLLGDGLSGEAGRARGYILTLHPRRDCATRNRNLVYDFHLLDRHLHADIARTPLDALTYVVFDTETTGLLPGNGDEIVQLAAVRIVNGRRVQAEVFDTLVNPGRTIPPSSTRIHGISDAMVADAPSVEEALRRFHNFAKGAVLVAHNASFDMAFIERAEARTGLHFSYPVLDTVLLSAIVWGDAENHSLDSLTSRLGVTLTAAARHTAVGDATATADVLLKLLPALQARGLLNFGDVEAESRRHSGLLKRSAA